MSTDALFADRMVKWGGAHILYFSMPWDFGPRKTKEYLFTGRFVTAAEAERSGLVNRVVPRDQLMRTLFRIDFDPGTNRLDVHMSRVRSKVDRGFPRPMLHTGQGVGYALRSERGGAVRA